MIPVASDIDYRALDACEALPEVTADCDLDEYEPDFEPMTLEDAEDDADQMLSDHDTTDHDVTDLGMTNLDEYDKFTSMTFEDTGDNGGGIPNNHEGYLEWYEAIEPGDDAEWFNFRHEINAQINEANDALSDQEDDTFDLDNMTQWLRDEYDVKLMRDGACLNRPCELS